MLTLVERSLMLTDRCPLQLPGMRAVPLVTSEDSNGTMSMLEMRIEPAATSPLQLLRRQVLAVYVVSGCIEVQVGEEMHRVGASGFVTIPSGLCHSFKNVGVTTGVLLITVTPGGYEEYLRSFGKIVQDEFIDPGQIRDLADRYGVEILSS